uniref:Prostaglandin reductase 1 n=1 Tax=Corethrella appendiculata TaxID=1370023 RepID=U5EP03_9DIPT
MVKAKYWEYSSKFVGEPKLSNFKLVEEDLRELKDEEFLAEAIFLSVDPYQQVYMNFYNFPTGIVMIGGQVAKVIDSKNEQFPTGCTIYGMFGWRTHTVVNLIMHTEYPPYILPDFGSTLPASLGLGLLGMPGNTAYFGFLEICRPKPDETVVISGAAGAVGSTVGQIAKIKGCRVIGIAGSDEKCKWLIDELGFDGAINYKTADIDAELKSKAPNGVDCYFDNVGGKISSIVLQNMNLFGRISVCGSISNYNNLHPDSVPEPLPEQQTTILFKQLTQQGFVVYRWKEQWLEGINQLLEWVKDGKIKYRETIYEGFEKQPEAFIGMLRGENIGKAIVKI